MESTSVTFDTQRVLALDQMLLSLGPGLGDVEEWSV
jgi:hypothetical protein